jgi:hypothetical protein
VWRVCLILVQGGGCSGFVVVALKRSYCCESVVAEAAVLFVDVREDRRK